MLLNRELQQRAVVPRQGRSLPAPKAQHDRRSPLMAEATRGRLAAVSGASSMGCSSCMAPASNNSSSNSSSKRQGLGPDLATEIGPSTPRLPKWPRCCAPGRSRRSTHGRRPPRLEARCRMSPEILRETSAAQKLSRLVALSPSGPRLRRERGSVGELL